MAALLALATLLGAGSCVGPAELTSGLPVAARATPDPRLTGQWHGVGNDGASEVVVTIVAAEQGALGVIWQYLLPHLGARACFTFVAWPVDVEGARYYDATWYLPENSESELPCKPYAPAGVQPGHVIAKADVDAKGRLHLRFLRNSTLLRLGDLGQLEARVIETAEDEVVDKYLLVEISSDDVAALLRGIPEEGLFSDPVGPLLRLPPALPTMQNGANVSGALP